MTKYFKRSKKPYFGAIFAQIWAKTYFPGEKGLSVFKYSKASCKKSEETNDPFLRKMPN